MIKLFNKIKEWFDGKKAYTALIMAAIPPAESIIRDFHQHVSIFTIMSSTEWNMFMLALGAIFIRSGIAKTDAKVEQVAGASTETPGPK